MKLSLFSLGYFLPLLPTLVAATGIPQQTTGPSQVDCITNGKYEGFHNNVYSPGCVNLIEDCLHHANTTTNLWGVKTCVAAATCDGTKNLITLAQCRNTGFPAATSLPHLDYNIYAGIVGDCAWQPGGCPITPQNYVDFVYGAMSDVGTTVWPQFDVRAYWWQPIVDWTATGDNVPYTNFDDWLHYSNS